MPETPAGPIDCHAHVFTAALPVTAGSRYLPDRDAPLEDYLAELDANGMAAGVLVQVSFLGTDNGYLLDALAALPGRLRGVAVVEPTISGERLSELAGAGVVGVRLNLIGRKLPDLASTDWRRHLDDIQRAGLHLEVQAEDAAWSELLPPLIDGGTTLVIDHFGRPESERAAGFAAVTAAARNPHVWVKLSGAYRFRADPARAAAALLDAAGPERLVWGSDWPWTQHPEITSYAALRTALSIWLAHDAGVLRRVLIDNPRRLYWRR